jgi:hypothetical protein
VSPFEGRVLQEYEPPRDIRYFGNDLMGLGSSMLFFYSFFLSYLFIQSCVIANNIGQQKLLPMFFDFISLEIVKNDYQGNEMLYSIRYI